MITIVLVLLLFSVLLISFITKLRSKSISKKWNILICVVLPILIIMLFVVVFYMSYARRKGDIHTLDHLLSAVHLSAGGNRVFSTEKEKIVYMDSLKMQMNQIDKIALNDKLISFFIGENKGMVSRMEEAQEILRNQYKRCGYLNSLLVENTICQKEIFMPKLFKVISQEYQELPTRNIAFKLKIHVDSIESVQVQIVKNKEILFRKSYKYNDDKLNAFVLPNVQSDSLEVKLGIIKNIDGIKTFIYTTDE